MKTETKAKPKAATAKNAPKSAPKATLTSAPKVETPAAAKVEPKAEGAKATLHANAKGLYWLQMTPGGNILRAYFVSLITAQVGDLASAAGKAFRLWPSVNVGGHIATGRMERKSGAFALTVQGVNYFTDPKQAADADALKVWGEAIRTGQAPKGYGQMSQFKE